MQAPQAGSSSSTLECVSELWPLLNTSSLAPCAPRLSFCVLCVVFSPHFLHPSIYYLLIFSACQYCCILWDVPSLSHSVTLTFPAHALLLCSFASCTRQKLSKMFMRGLTVTHLFTRNGFSPTSSRTQSPLRWIALPLSSLPSSPILLLLTSRLAPFSLPFLSEKWLLQRCLPDKCLWKVEELWRNAGIFSPCGRREWRLEEI